MKTKISKTRPLKDKEWEPLNFSQQKVDGFDLTMFQKFMVLLIGAGAIGCHVGLALARKGIGHLDICDDDRVETKNLTRQLFSRKDVGKNKAIALAKFLSTQGFFKTTIRGFPYRFQEALELKFDFPVYDAVICGVDNNATRVAVSRYCLKKNIPLIMSAVSRDGNQMYCLIQKPDAACFGCILPRAVNDSSYPCNLPGIIDITQVVSGFAVYALDTLLMDRYCEWNYKMIFLNGSVPEISTLIPKRQDCLLCQET